MFLRLGSTLWSNHSEVHRCSGDTAPEPQSNKTSPWGRSSPLCAQQPVDQTAQPIRLTEDRHGDLDPDSPGTPLALPMDPNTLPVDRIRAAGSQRQTAGSGPQRRCVEDPDPVTCCLPPAARRPSPGFGRAPRTACRASSAPGSGPGPGCQLRAARIRDRGVAVVAFGSPIPFRPPAASRPIPGFGPATPVDHPQQQRWFYGPFSPTHGLRTQLSSAGGQELAVDQATVGPSAGHELGVAAGLDHPAAIENDDPIGIAYGRQPMGDDHCGAAAHQTGEGVPDQCLALRVQRRGRRRERSRA